MKISFHVASEPLKERTREVVIIPRIGDYVTWHRDDEELCFRVLKVIHNLEDRAGYQIKGQPRESVCLVVEKVDRSELQG
jgi:hypothetical protein